MSKDIILRGEGGKGGSARQPVEAENTLKTVVVVEVLEVWSEGPIVGLENAWKDVFLNQTPVENADGTLNFQGVEGQFRVGSPTQTVIPGFEEVSAVFPMGTTVTQASSVSQVIRGTDITAAYITLDFPSGIWDADNTVGDRNENTVLFNIYITQTAPALESEFLAKSATLTGKTVTAYQTQYRITPPDGATAWQFRVERISDDDDLNLLKSSMFNIAYWTEIQTFGPPLTYENTAIGGLKVPAQEVGNQIPTRGYLPKGIICSVPDNWDESTKTYSGSWSGAFVQAWTEDPAWVLYDVITNLRYGVGQALGQSIKVNKWDLYDCSVYNNELLDNGFGVMEPRFTFNALIQKQVNAWQLLQTIASVMKAVVTIDNESQISVIQDRPTPTSKIITNANVLGGMFTYNSTDVTERPTAASITFNDREDRYLPRTIQEPTSDDTVGNSFIEKYGYNPVDLVAYATVTEAQARRLAKHVLYAANYEYDNVVFAMGMNVVGLQLGDVVGVLDNDYITSDNTTMLAGRVLSVAGTTITLDRAVELSEAGFTFSVMAENYGSIIERTTNTTGVTDTIVLDSALPAGDYTLNEFYCTKTSVIEPRLYRILSIEEQEAGQYILTCNFYDPQKWGVVELGLPLEPYAYNIQKPLPAVTGLAITEDFRNDDILETNLIRLTWDYNAKHLSYQIRINMNKSKIVLYETAELFLEFENIPAGIYDVTIRAVGLTRTLSPPAYITYNYGVLDSTLFPPVNFQVAGGGLVFNAESVAFTWEYNTINPAGVLRDYVVHLYTADGLTKVGDYIMPYVIDQTSAFYKGGQQVFTREAIIDYYGFPVRSFMLKLFARDLIGRLSITSNDIVVTNPAPALPGAGSTVTGFGRDIVLTLGAGSVVPDAADLIVAMSDTTGFTPTAATWYWRTVAASALTGAALRSGVEGTFYVRFAISDTYNDTDLNWTPEFTVIITDGMDLIVFATPVPVTWPVSWLAQETVKDEDGKVLVLTTITWDAVAYASIYTVAWRVSGSTDDFQEYNIATNTLKVDLGLLGKTYEVKVRATNVNSVGDWSTLKTVDTTADTTPPAPPTAFTVSQGYDTLSFNWVNPTAKDYDHTIVYWYNGTSYVNIAEISGTSHTINNLATGLSGSFKLSSVDTVGNESALTAAVVGATAGVDYADVTGDKPVGYTVPAAPTWGGTPYTKTTVNDVDGTVKVLTTLTWVAPAGDVTSYIVSYRENGTSDAYSEYPITANSLQVDIGFIGKTYDVRVKALNGPQESVWSLVTTVDTTASATGISAPSGYSSTQGYDNVVLSWTNPATTRYAKTNVYWWNGTAYIKVAEVSGTSYHFPELTPGLTGYFRLSSVDKAGNESAMTGSFSGTTSKVDYANVDGTKPPADADKTVGSVSALSDIVANLGTVTAGNIIGNSNIEITGSAKFNGSIAIEGQVAAMAVNTSSVRYWGIRAYGALVAVYGTVTGAGTGILGKSATGIGVKGEASGAGVGVSGTCYNTGGYGVFANNTTSGYALYADGKTRLNGVLLKTGTELVSNLNADRVDNYHAGNSSGQVAVSNGTQCTNLNAEKLGGYRADLRLGWATADGGGTATVASHRLHFASTAYSTEFVGSGYTLTIQAISDRRKKQDIVDEPLGLDFINSLRPRQFRMIKDPTRLCHGFISQEIEPLTGNEDVLCHINPNGFYGSEYSALDAPLTNAIQKLTEITSAQAKAMEELLAKIEDMQKQIDKLTTK